MGFKLTTSVLDVQISLGRIYMCHIRTYKMILVATNISLFHW